MRFDRKTSLLRSRVAILCTIILVPGDALAYALQSSAVPARPPNGQTVKLSPEQLDSLVADAKRVYSPVGFRIFMRGYSSYIAETAGQFGVRVPHTT